MAPLLQLLSVVVLSLVFVTEATRCSNPTVRKEWRTLSKDQQADYLRAVKCLGSLPHDDALTPTVNLSISLIPPVNKSSSFYDDIVYIHMDLNTRIHFTGQFYPWHRAYIWGYERVLKEKCGFKGVHPWWDWTLDAPDFYHSNMLNPDPKVGFGGWGDPNNDFQINDGVFADFMVSYPAPNHVRRNYTLQPLLSQGNPVLINTTFTKKNYDYSVNSFPGDFGTFQNYTQTFTGPHFGPHFILGADMAGTCPTNAPNCIAGPKWSANDPLFFMHHSTIDKLWHDWQNKHPMNFYSFYGGSIDAFGAPNFATNQIGVGPAVTFDSQIPGDNLLWKNLTIWDMMDTQAGPLCYIYE